MDTNKIYVGDSAVVLKSFPSDSIDITVTSPPYDNLRKYNGYVFDFETIAQELYRVTKPGGVVVWVVGDATINGSETGTSFKQALYFMQCGFRLHDTMIYQTDKPPMNDRRYQSSFEYMFVFSKGKVSTFNPIMVPSSQAGKKRSSITYREQDGSLKDQWRSGVYSATKIKPNVWYIQAGASKGTLDKEAFAHPGTFPEKLANDHIISWSNSGDIVLDPFAGSGTTLKMAKLSGRQYIGIEISQEYADIAQARVDKAIIQEGL